MASFTKFNEWKKTKFHSLKEEENPKEDTENAELLAQISSLTAKKKQYVKYKEDFKAQILDIDIRLLQFEVEKNNLKEKRRQLENASKIADETGKEGKTNG